MSKGDFWAKKSSRGSFAKPLDLTTMDGMRKGALKPLKSFPLAAGAAAVVAAAAEEEEVLGEVVG